MAPVNGMPNGGGFSVQVIYSAPGDTYGQFTEWANIGTWGCPAPKHKPSLVR